MNRRKAATLLLTVLAGAYGSGIPSAHADEVSPEEFKNRILEMSDNYDKQADLFMKICVTKRKQVIENKIIVDPKLGSMSCPAMQKVMIERNKALHALQALAENGGKPAAAEATDGSCAQPEQQVVPEKQLTPMGAAAEAAASTGTVASLAKDAEADKASKQPCPPGARTAYFSTECAKEVGCDIGRSILDELKFVSKHRVEALVMAPSTGGGAGVIAMIFSPERVEALRKSLGGCMLDTTQSSCAAELIEHFIPQLIANFKGYWTLVKMVGGWAKDKVVSSWKTTAPIETQTSDAAFYSTQPGDSKTFMEKWVEDPLIWVKDNAFELLSALNEQIKEDFGCNRWSGEPHAPGSICMEPMTGWDCATCHQRFEAVCGYLNFIGTEAIDMMVTALATEGIAKAVKVAVKFAKIPAEAAHTALVAKIPQIAKIERAVGSAATKVIETKNAAKQAVKTTITRAGRAVLGKAAEVLKRRLAKFEASEAGKTILKSPVTRGAKVVGKGAIWIAKKGFWLTKKIMTSALNPFVLWEECWKAGKRLGQIVFKTEVPGVPTPPLTPELEKKLALDADPPVVPKDADVVELNIQPDELGPNCTVKAAEVALEKSTQTVDANGTLIVQVPPVQGCEAKTFKVP